MIRVSLSVISKAIAALESLGKNEEALIVKEELFKLETQATIKGSYEYVNMGSELAERLLHVLNDNKKELYDIVPNEFLLDSKWMIMFEEE